MATEVVRPNPLQRLVGFVRDVRSEMDKVTWPDQGQVRQLSIFVVIFTIFVGILIAVIDLVLQGFLQNLIPSLLGRR
jgi:preprotein translocase SecE subunit